MGKILTSGVAQCFGSEGQKANASYCGKCSEPGFMNTVANTSDYGKEHRAPYNPNGKSIIKFPSEKSVRMLAEIGDMIHCRYVVFG